MHGLCCSWCSCTGTWDSLAHKTCTLHQTRQTDATWNNCVHQQTFSYPLHPPRGLISQTCKTEGCRFAVVDSNENINGLICSIPKPKVFLQQQHIYMTQCCIRSPASGGRFRKPSKYCEMHLFLEEQAAASLLTPTCQHHIPLILYWKRTRWGLYLTMTVLTSLYSAESPKE